MFFSPSRQPPALTWNWDKTTSFHILRNRGSPAFVSFEIMQCEELKASFNKLRICCIWNYMRAHKSSRWKISVPQPSTRLHHVIYNQEFTNFYLHHSKSLESSCTPFLWETSVHLLWIRTAFVILSIFCSCRSSHYYSRGYVSYATVTATKFVVVKQ